MAFDPDAYLAEKTNNPAPKFDPDEYLASKEAATPPKSDSYLQTGGNLLAGAVRGAGSIGATILAPLDMAKDALGGKGLSLESNRQRRADMTAGLQSLGADTDSTAYKGGKIATEIAGTLPIGGLVGKAVSPVAPTLGTAIGSGGFSLGSGATGNAAANMLLRATGGAINGAATAGAVNPDDAKMGAILGGAMPVGAKIAGETGKLIGKGASALTANTLGAISGAGADAVKAAYQSGKNGSTAFLDNMRGKVGFDDVVDEAKRGLSNMRAERQAAYRSGMADISADKAVLDFAPIDKAMGDVADIGKYKGVTIKSKAADTVDELKSVIDTWKGLDPAEYHTPEGLDALKQSIGDIRDSAQFGTPARRAADQIYNSVKDEIVKQAPTYSKVMKDYSEASAVLSETERALSLGKNTSKDTAIRKLQSLLRNNAQTSYGNRLNIAQGLEEKGGVDLMPSIAGQAMNSWTPRGMVGAITKGGAGPLAYLHPATLAALPATSPRVIGEAAYALGRGAGGAKSALAPASKAIPASLRGLLDDGELQNALLRTVPLRSSLGILGAQQ